MKIVHIAQNYDDSWGYHENLLPQYHSCIGNEVTVITSEIRNSERKDDGNKTLPVYYYEKKVKILRLPIHGEFKGRFVIFKKLLDILKKEKPDYIFHHGITAPSLMISANYKKNNSAVFLAADNHADLNISGRFLFWRVFYYQTLWRLLLKRILKYVDLVFGVTPARCYFPEKYLGIPKKKIRLLPMGVDVDGVNQLGVVLKKANKDKFTLVTGGKWTKEKELDNLINAVSDLDVDLIIFGQLVDPQLEKLIDSVVNVKYCGWQDRKGTFDLLANADMAVWTKQHTTLIEDAIAVETPLLLRYHGSTSHLIRGNGVYLFTDNPLEIRHDIELIIENPDILNKFRKNAKTMKEMLSYKRIAMESIDYSFNTEPKCTHLLLLGSIFCNPNNKQF